MRDWILTSAKARGNVLYTALGDRGGSEVDVQRGVAVLSFFLSLHESLTAHLRHAAILINFTHDKCLVKQCLLSFVFPCFPMLETITRQRERHVNPAAR